MDIRASRARRTIDGYTISTVSERYDIHPQTLRMYEREGLLKPFRSVGNTRYYSDDDLERLEAILTLTRDLGVNLAGVEVILNLREQMARMREEMNQFLEAVQSELNERISERARSSGGTGDALVPRSSFTALRRVVVTQQRTTTTRAAAPAKAIRPARARSGEEENQ